MKAEIITDALCIIGEGPVYDEINKRLYMTDINGKRFRTIDWKTLKVEDRVMPEQIGFIFLGTGGEIYSGAQTGIYEITGDLFKKINNPFTLKGLRFNDGKVGPDGCVYGGTITRDFSGAFYCMDKKGTVTELFDKVGNSNGLDWDEKKGIFYYTDTYKKTTDCFDFVGNGKIENRRVLIEHTEGSPDGMTIDENGNLWLALWGSGKIVCIDTQSGKIIEEITLPVSQPSCCTFGGDDFDTLIITSASHNLVLKDEPLAGCVLAVKPGVKGKKVNRFKFEK
ncbi:MAG: SMP-30/gluconolactonase/LRE family protein [Ruminococcaceae bacterium]|nr:SMP-30/gluconolactonase/LRE family protein [Oscillospiraceae bacterium]